MGSGMASVLLGACLCGLLLHTVGDVGALESAVAKQRIGGGMAKGGGRPLPQQTMKLRGGKGLQGEEQGGAGVLAEAHRDSISRSPPGQQKQGDLFACKAKFDPTSEASSLSASSDSLGMSALHVERQGEAGKEVGGAEPSLDNLGHGSVVLNDRNRLVAVLGSGAFGTVYASLQPENRCAAVKVQRAGDKYCQVTLDEIELLEKVAKKRKGGGASGGSVRGGDCVVELIETFSLPGAKKQMCLSFEMLGPSLLDLIIDHGYAGIPVDVVKRIALSALKGLDFLHTQCGIIHTDVKPENILLTLPEAGLQATPSTGIPAWWSKHSVHNQQGARKLRPGWSWSLETSEMGAKLVDLGNSCFESHHYSEKIQTIEYRSPEVVIGSGYGTAADIWSLACTIFELVTGEYLFDPQEGTNKHGQVCYSREEDLIAHHQELVGSFDKALSLPGKHSASLFNPDGSMRRINGLKFWPLLEVLKEKYAWKHQDASDLVAFLEPMLRADPAERATAAELLSHPWLAGQA